jgi:hypothetical protein
MKDIHQFYQFLSVFTMFLLLFYDNKINTKVFLEYLLFKAMYIIQGSSHLYFAQILTHLTVLLI